MNTSEVAIDDLRRELVARLVQSEQRTQVLEALLLHNGSSHGRHSAQTSSSRPGVSMYRGLGRSHLC